MKQYISTGVIAVIVGLVVAYFTYTLNKEVPDVRYTLSEKIPTKFVDAQAVENVQQLIVKNTGNDSIPKIQIKIKRNIEKADILKNSLNDIVTEKISNGYFEAIYPELPPGGSFTYSFKTLADGISKTDLDIRHNKGEVKDALSGENKTIVSVIVSSIFVIVFLFYVSIGIITLMVSFLESKVNYEKYDDFLKRKKPIYVSTKKWSKLRKESIKNFSTTGYSNPREIESTVSYKVLNQEKPNYLNTEEWAELKEKAINQLEKDYGEAINILWIDLTRYFIVNKPIHFSEGKWSEIVNKINKEYIARKKYDSVWLGIKELNKEITASMPKGIIPSYWSDYIDYLKKQYYTLILQEIYSNFTLAEEFIKSEKSPWLHDDDYRKILSQAKKIIETDKLKSKYEKLSEDANKKISELEREKIKVIELKNKIEHQLTIIHEFLTDSTVLDRTEEYSNVFAPGNFENLKRLAQSLKNESIVQTTQSSDLPKSPTKDRF